MGLETKTTTLLDVKGEPVYFRVTQLPFKSSRKVLVRLTKRLGPAIATVASQASSLKDLQDGSMIDAVGDFAQALDDDDLDFFSEAFGPATEFNKDNGAKWPRLTTANQSGLFQGDLGLYLKWLWFCVEANYADFMGGFLAPQPQPPEAPAQEN